MSDVTVMNRARRASAVLRAGMARHERLLWAALVVLVVSVQWPALKGFYYRASDVPPPPSSIQWRTDLASALLEAQRTDRAVLVDFSADWCPPCIVMKHDVWPDDSVEHRIATLFRAVRRERAGAVLALDNGDTFHGTMAAVHTRGDVLSAPMAALGLDGMTAHWEFAYGLARLGEIAQRLPYPILAANYHGSALELQPFTIVDRGGIRVAVIGLSAVVAKHLLPRDHRSALEMTMGESELRTLIPSVRRDREVDLVLVLSHLGFPQDCRLAAAVPGIDVLLSGHTHNRLDAPAIVNDTLIMQSGAHGSFVGRLDLTVARDGVTDWDMPLCPLTTPLNQTPI